MPGGTRWRPVSGDMKNYVSHHELVLSIWKYRVIQDRYNRSARSADQTCLSFEPVVPSRSEVLFFSNSYLEPSVPASRVTVEGPDLIRSFPSFPARLRLVLKCTH